MHHRHLAIAQAFSPHAWAGIEDRIRCLEFLLFTLYSDIPIVPDFVNGENSIDLTLSPRVSGLTGPVDLVGLELFIRYQ